jgi:hypothetical protein
MDKEIEGGLKEHPLYDGRAESNLKAIRVSSNWNLIVCIHESIGGKEIETMRIGDLVQHTNERMSIIDLLNEDGLQEGDN